MSPSTKTSCLLILYVVSPLAAAQEAVDSWIVATDVQALVGSFRSSIERDSLNVLGFFVKADYLEKGGVTFGYNRTALSFLNANSGIDQDDVFLSGRWSLTPDWASGRITVRLDQHTISNDDPDNGTSDVDVIAPQLSYQNFANTFYVDVGYARSNFGDSLSLAGKLEVTQWTPTLGFGFNDSYDWLQLRGYLIDFSNPLRAQSLDSTESLEVKWIHWFDGRGPIGIDNLRVSALAGERIYAVDHDAASVYNLADMQTGSASIGGEWLIGERNKLMLLMSYEKFENRDIGNAYSSGSVYLNFNHRSN